MKLKKFIVFLLILFIPFIFPFKYSKLIAITLLMAYSWIFEILPIEITGLFPLFLFPLFGVLDIKEVSASYGDNLIFLFLGGFFIAKAIEVSGLARKISLFFISILPKTPFFLLTGISLATFILSGWISNTAITIISYTIALSILKGFSLKENSNFKKILFISIAYSASLGGILTPVGTPPNIIYLGIIGRVFGEKYQFSFFEWIKLSLPLSFLIFTFMLLGFYVFFIRKEKIDLKIEIESLKLNTYEKRVLFIFLLTSFLWITRPLWEKFFYLKYLKDSGIAILCSFLLFIIPRDRKENLPLLTWEKAREVPWGILLVFGGGLALASAFEKTGFTEFIGISLKNIFSHLNPTFLLLIFITFGVFFTEVTSNTASSSLLLPIIAEFTKVLHLPPHFLMFPFTLSLSFAFMLPSATPPNAIILSSGDVRIKDMAKIGFFMNILSIIITFFYFYILR